MGDDDVLVQVHATTVNPTDCSCPAAKPFFMRLFTGLIRPRATILGNEFAGVVAAVGVDVTAFSIGEKVFGYNEGRSEPMPSTRNSRGRVAYDHLLGRDVRGGGGQPGGAVGAAGAQD